MNEKVKHWMKAGLAAGLCLLLSGCGDKVETPEAYVIGDNSAVPLDSFLTEEEGGVLISVSPTAKEVAKAQKEKEKAEKQAQKEKEKAEKKAQKEQEKAEKKKDKDGEAENTEAEVMELSEQTGEEPAENLGPDGETIVEPSETYTYTYEEVPAAALERYAEALTGEEQGFTAIDMERVPLSEPPTFDSEEGSAIFAKAGAEENTLFIIDINWAEGVHTINVKCPEGALKSGGSDSGESEDASQIMTLVETMDYVRSLRPADLGLEGESMSEYNLIPIQGSPLVDGEVCRHVNVYQEDPNTDTNTFIGSFLIGINKIYRLDNVNSTVERIR